MTAPLRWRVWLGAGASIWSHRGYTVRGESVYTTSYRDALRLARQEVGVTRLHVAQVPDGTYCYGTRRERDADETGAAAAAVVSYEGDLGAGGEAD